MSATTGAGEPLLRLTRLERSFPGVVALRGASLDVHPGEIHALVGENGAGKSTLVRILTGAIRPDAGSIRWEGREVCPESPRAAARIGIGVIHQDFNLIPALSVRENLFLGREGGAARGHGRGIGVIDHAAERVRAREVLQRVGLAADPETSVRDLDVAAQQLVEVAKALLTDVRLLILDEPTASLSPRETDRLLAILRDLRSSGAAMLFITHRLDEVMRVTDRVTVLRDGASLGTWPTADLTIDRMVELMVGRPLDPTPHARAASGAPGPPLLAAASLRGGRVRDATFTLHAGEILGVAGLVGAGRTDLARLVAGADRPLGGRITLDGRPASFASPKEAIDAGIGFLTEDRKAQGLVLGLTALDNFALPSLSRWTRRGWLNERPIVQAFDEKVRALRLRVAGPLQLARQLSGGNQQKLLVARWLERRCRVLIFDEPTRGIDVGAKEEMYGIMRHLAREGRGILMISSELPEILRMSDRILVMREGRITGTITNGPEVTQQDVMRLAVA